MAKNSNKKQWQKIILMTKKKSKNCRANKLENAMLQYE